MNKVALILLILDNERVFATWETGARDSRTSGEQVQMNEFRTSSVRIFSYRMGCFVCLLFSSVKLVVICRFNC